jgi:hypothetical protein
MGEVWTNLHVFILSVACLALGFGLGQRFEIRLKTERRR